MRKLSLILSVIFAFYVANAQNINTKGVDKLNFSKTQSLKKSEGADRTQKIHASKDNPCEEDAVLPTVTTSWQTTNGSITAGGYYMYKFSAIAGKQYSFKTGCGDGATANFDTFFYLFDSDCEFIVWNDDCGEEELTSDLEWICTTAGDYYLIVAAFDEDDYGSYTLVYKYGEPVPYTFTVIPYPATGGTTSGSGVYHLGDEVIITAIPNSGYTFLGWSFTTDIEDVEADMNPIPLLLESDWAMDLTIYAFFVPITGNEIELTNLTVSAGTLTPAFAPYFTYYTVNVAANINSVDISATARNLNSFLQIDHEDLPFSADGTGSVTANNVPLDLGYNYISISVYDFDYDDSKIYMLTIIRDETSSINDISSDIKLNIYPNPVRDELVIDGNDLQINSVSVINLQGQTVMTGKINNGRVNISSLPQGIYFVKIDTDKGLAVRKIVKQ